MKPTTVDEYIENLADERKTKLVELRQIVRASLSAVDEVLKWGQPAFVEKDGMILLVIGCFKEHINFVVTPSAQQAFADELSGYTLGKGSVQLPYDKPLPAELIRKMAAYRQKEYREDGVNWK